MQHRAKALPTLHYKSNKSLVASILQTWHQQCLLAQTRLSISTGKTQQHDLCWLGQVYGKWKQTHRRQQTIVYKLRLAFGMLTNHERITTNVRAWRHITLREKLYRARMAQCRAKNSTSTRRHAFGAFVRHSRRASAHNCSPAFVLTARMRSQLAIRAKQECFSTWLTFTCENIRLMTGARRIVERCLFHKLRQVASCVMQCVFASCVAVSVAVSVAISVAVCVSATVHIFSFLLSSS